VWQLPTLPRPWVPAPLTGDRDAVLGQIEGGASIVGSRGGRRRGG